MMGTSSRAKRQACRGLLRCLIAFAALWVPVVAGQDTAPAPPPDQSPAAVAPRVGPRVWVNTRTHVYHYQWSGWYGTTEHGKYVNEAEALAEGDRPAANEHHPVTVDVFPPTPATTPGLPTGTPAPEPTASPAAQSELLSACVTAVAAQSDPAKLATLGRRSANPRLKRILYYLARARAAGANPGEIIEQAQQQNGSAGTPRAPLVKASLLRNLKICDGLGLLTEGNLAGLRRGAAPTVTRGPYVGENAEVDHIVPLALAGSLGNELANLEMLPAALNRAKSAKVGERQLDTAKRFHEAGLLSDAELATVQDRFRPAGTQKYELPEQ